MRRSRTVLAAAAGALAVLSPVLFAADLVTPAEKAAASEITADGLKADIRFLSSDLLEGRGPATRGDALAEAYVQARLEGMGLSPGAPGGGWIQKVPLVGIKPSVLRAGVVRGAEGLGERRPRRGLRRRRRGPEARVEDRERRGRLRRVRHRRARVPVGRLQGRRPQGEGPPDDEQRPRGDPAEPNLFAGKTRLWYGRWDYKYLMAAKMGAAGAIVIHTTPSAGYGWQVIQTSWNGEVFELPDDGTPAGRDEDVGDGGALEEGRGARREGPRRAPEERGVALFPARASRRHVLAGLHEHRGRRRSPET